MNRGVDLMKAGQYGGALDAFAAAEDLIDGSKELLHINRACLYTGQGQFSLALQELSHAVRCHTSRDDFEEDEDLKPLWATEEGQGFLADVFFRPPFGPARVCQRRKLSRALQMHRVSTANDDSSDSECSSSPSGSSHFSLAPNNADITDEVALCTGAPATSSSASTISSPEVLPVLPSVHIRPANPPTAHASPSTEARLGISASAWNTLWHLPGGMVPTGWQSLPPLMDVAEFVLVEVPTFLPGSDLCLPLTIHLLPQQKALLQNPNVRLWVSEYSATGGRFVRWNLFARLVVNGLQLRRDTYQPRTYSPKHHHGPTLIDLLDAGANIEDFSFRFQIRKDVQEFQKVVQKDVGFDVGHVVFCIGTEMDPDDFLHRRLPTLPTGRYRHDPVGGHGEVTCTRHCLTVSLQDPLTLEPIQHPVRGRDCDHLACFDLRTMLIQSKEHRTTFEWICGICQRPMSGLVYDPEVRDLLQRYPALTEIKLDLSRWGRPGDVRDASTVASFSSAPLP
eukprot:EG_transcript_2337